MRNLLKLQVSTPLSIVAILVVTNVFTIEKLYSHEKCEDSYNFINSYFACNHENTIDKGQYSDLKSRLASFINKKKDEGNANIVSVWFRDLEGGPTLGINERIDFIPASLLKLPLVLTFLDIAENNPSILQKITAYSDKTAPVPEQVFFPADPIVKNRSYTIEELINHTMLHSDNLASQLLFDYLRTSFNDNPLIQTYRDLGIIDPGANLNMAAVNTKEYSSIFRQLYNVSFLNKNYSEKILALLTQSDFEDGLRRGIPEGGGVTVANKFGERSLETGEKQLHDCGIVYYPDNPYLLCIMTRGKNFADLSDVIGEISKEVYQEFDSRRLDK